MWFPPTASSSSRPSGTMPNSSQGRDQLTGNYEKPSTTPPTCFELFGVGLRGPQESSCEYLHSWGRGTCVGLVSGIA